jgi:hypothetical protein
VKFDDHRPGPEGEAEAKARADALPRNGGFGVKRAGLLLVRVALDLLLVDAAVETWLAGSPFRWGIVVAAALYFGLSLAAVLQGSRLAAPGLVTQTPAAFYILLGVLGSTTSWPEGFDRGVRILNQPTPIVLAGATLVVVCLAVFRVAILKGAWAWFRIAVLGLGIYASAAIVLGGVHRAPYAARVQGQSVWEVLPYWLRGAFVGGLVLVPLGLVRELGTSMSNVVLKGYFRWMIVFGLGTWIAYNGFSLHP